MARTKAYLETEAAELGITLDGTETTSAIMDLLMNVKLAGQDTIVDQISPMNAKDLKTLFSTETQIPWVTPEMDAEVWQNDSVVAEVKFDGVRAKMHLVDGTVRIDTRGRSDVDYAFGELTASLPQFAFSYPPELEGTILDGELIMETESLTTSHTTTEGTLTSTMAIVGSLPEKAIALQQANGWAQYKAFDVIKARGLFITDSPWTDRRMTLEAIVPQLDCQHIQLSEVFVTPTSRVRGITVTVIDSLRDKFESLINGGGEGIMVKDITAEYSIGKRTAAWRKLKKFSSYDGFITGSLPGEGAFTGLVGSILVSAHDAAGKVVEFANFSQVDMDTRRAMTAPDGTLNPEFLGKVVEVAGQEVTKNRRLRHAILLRWREDRNFADVALQL